MRKHFPVWLEHKKKIHLLNIKEKTLEKVLKIFSYMGKYKQLFLFVCILLNIVPAIYVIKLDCNCI